MLVVGIMENINRKSQTASGFFKKTQNAIGQTVSALFESKIYVPAEQLITLLSFPTGLATVVLSK